MDTVHNFLTDDTAPDELQELGLNPDKFIVGGASKESQLTLVDFKATKMTFKVFIIFTLPYYKIFNLDGYI